MGRIRHSFHLPAFYKTRFRREFDLAFTAIDATHPGLDLKTASIPIEISSSESDLGEYKRHPGTGVPEKILISRRGDTYAFTLLHEMGHHFENVAIPGSAFGVRHWQADSRLARWRAAILASGEAQRLLQVQANPIVEVTKDDGTTSRREINKSYINYLCKDEEFWARSYAQYVTLRNGGGVLQDQLAIRTSPGGVLPLQWSTVAFEPIAAEFDTLFREIGWQP